MQTYKPIVAHAIRGELDMPANELDVLDLIMPDDEAKVTAKKRNAKAMANMTMTFQIEATLASPCVQGKDYKCHSGLGVHLVVAALMPVHVVSASGHNNKS
jgi:hypothetical protein